MEMIGTFRWAAMRELYYIVLTLLFWKAKSSVKVLLKEKE